jgi:hypothetical protein
MLTALAIWAGVTGTLGLLMALARTPPDEAASNLSRWLEWTGLRHIPGWLKDRAADRWVFRYGLGMMGVLLFLGGMLFDNWTRSPIIVNPLPPSPPSSRPPQPLQKLVELTWNDSLIIERAFLSVAKPCAVKISASNPETMNARNILAHIIRLNNSCDIFDDRADTEGRSFPRPDIDAPPPSAPPNGVIMRWHTNYNDGQKVYETLNGILFVTEGHRMPDGSAPNLIWLQAGSGFPWKR